MSWSGIIYIYFINHLGRTIQNTISVGSVVIGDNEFAYVDLNNSNGTSVSVLKSTVSLDMDSNYMATNRLVLAYRNASSDNLYLVNLKTKMINFGTIATKNYWSGTKNTI